MFVDKLRPAVFLNVDHEQNIFGLWTIRLKKTRHAKMSPSAPEMCDGHFSLFSDNL